MTILTTTGEILLLIAWAAIVSWCLMRGATYCAALDSRRGAAWFVAAALLFAVSLAVAMSTMDADRHPGLCLSGHQELVPGKTVTTRWVCDRWSEPS